MKFGVFPNMTLYELLSDKIDASMRLVAIETHPSQNFTRSDAWKIDARAMFKM